ncbi:HAD family hydrolase [Thermodesulfobacteriota bacterium]
MLKAILFDLDNTLVLFDESKFYDGYLRRIAPIFADIMPPAMFQKRLITTTRSLKQNNGSVTNKEYFMEVFSREYENRREELWQRFEYFYDNEYDKLEAIVSLPDSLHDVFDELLGRRIKLVLASNPIFPLRVQMKRAEWAGLEHIPFYWVTHIENMTFCKPRVEYYLEICRNIDEQPGTCLMVGNDSVNDMIAARAGLKTYLTDDALGIDSSSLTLSRNRRKIQAPHIPAPDFKGPLAGVIAAAGRLENKDYFAKPAIAKKGVSDGIFIKSDT